jgi:hypothetical protein
MNNVGALTKLRFLYNWFITGARYEVESEVSMKHESYNYTNQHYHYLNNPLMTLDKVFNSFDFMCHTGFSAEGCAFHSAAK